jgi:hypothetical protein
MRIFLAVMLAIASAAMAADSCTNWMPQPDGTQFRTCVDGQGRQYCEQLGKDGKIGRVSCK